MSYYEGRPLLFRTENELMNVLNRISVVIAYDNICPHGRLCGVLGNNQNNADSSRQGNTLCFSVDALRKMPISCISLECMHTSVRARFRVERENLQKA